MRISRQLARFIVGISDGSAVVTVSHRPANLKMPRDTLTGQPTLICYQ
jgi:hypothetical protein